MLVEETSSPGNELLKNSLDMKVAEPDKTEQDIITETKLAEEETETLSESPVVLNPELEKLAETYDPADYVSDPEQGVEVASLTSNLFELGKGVATKISNTEVFQKIKEVDQKILERAQEKDNMLKNTIDLSKKSTPVDAGLDNVRLQEIEDMLLRVEGTLSGTTSSLKRSAQTVYDFLANPSRTNMGDIDALEFDRIVKAQFGGDINRATKKIKIENIIAEANRMGLVDIIKDIKYRTGKEEVLPVKTYMGMVLKADLIYKRMDQIQTKSGPYTMEDINEYQDLLGLYNKFLELEPVTRSEYGRSLNMLNYFEIGEDLTAAQRKSFVEANKKLQGEYPQEITVEEFTQIMGDVKQLSQSEMTRWWQQVGGMGLYRAWEEFFVNQLLLNYITPVVNFLGGESFALVRAAENYVAATIDLAEYPIKKTAQYITGDRNLIERGARFNEANAYLQGWFTGQIDGLLASYRYIRTGQRLGANKDKLDLSVRKYTVKERFLTKEFMNTTNGKIVGAGIDYLGTVNRLGGNILNTGDQTVRGVVMAQMVKLESKRAYNNVLKNGGSLEDAKKAEINTLERLTPDQAKRITDEIDTGTFLKDLPPGIFRDLQKISNYPGFKLIQPYHKAITNIFFETSKRNPFTALIMPSVRKDILSGDPAVRQLALSKMSFLAGTSYVIAAQSYGNNWVNWTEGEEGPNVMITGHPPADKAEREAWIRAGYKPFSFGIKQDDGTYKWISYGGLDPISGFLMMSADMAYTAHKSSNYQYANGETDLERASPDFFAGLTNGYYRYLSDQHFAETMATIAYALNAPGQEAEDILSNLMASGTGTVTRFAISGVPYFGSSLPRYIKMWQDPSFYNMEMTEQQYQDGLLSNMLKKSSSLFGKVIQDDDPPPRFIIQANKALNTVLFNAGFGSDAPKDLNIWGESDPEFAQKARRTPFQIYGQDKSKRFRIVDEWMSLHHTYLDMPSEKIFANSTHLFRDQYRDLILFMNTDSNLDGVSDMLEEIETLITSPSFQEMTFVGPDGQSYKDLFGQITEVRRIFNTYKDKAILQLVEKYPELREKRDQAEFEARASGKTPPASL